MKHVSLNKIKPSMLTKVPGLFILGLLAVAFLVFPLAAFAGCGGGQAAAQAGTVQSVMSLFGKPCGGTPLSTQQASQLAASWVDPTKAAANKNATIGNNPAQASAGNNPAQASANPKASANPNASTGSRIGGIQFLGAIARCTFVTVKDGEKATLQNGDVALVSVTQKGGAVTPLVGEIVNGKLVLLSGNGNGQHAVKLVSNGVNVKLGNATISQS